MTTLKDAADALDRMAIAAANELADAQAMPFPAAWGALVSEFVRRAKERNGSAFSDADGRSAMWRVRVRLYNATHPDEPDADSDPDLAADAPGATVIAGLPAVGEHLALLAAKFHGQPCLGLDTETLMHRLKSLRPTISRRGGDAVWRVPYRVVTHSRWVGGEMTTANDQVWLARVDVVRELP